MHQIKIPKRISIIHPIADIRRKSIIKIILFLSFFLIITISLSAQHKSDTTYQNTIPANDSIHQKDIKDLMHQFFGNNKKKGPSKNLLKPKNLQLAVLPAVGYTIQTGFAGVISAIGAFRTDTGAIQKISSINSSITYSQYNQIIFPVFADIWTKRNKYNIILDWRYMKYPSSTFGLGGHTLETDGYTIDFNYFKLHQTVLKELSKDFYGGVGFFYDRFWNVREVDPPTGILTSYEKYGLSPSVTAAGPVLRLLYDSRLNQINPDNGWYGNVLFRPNFTFLGSDNNWQSLLLEYRKYFKFSSRGKNVLAIWSYNWLSLGKNKPPYLLLPSTGWDDQYNTGRGYIQSRFRGKNMLYLETEYRFGITSNGLLGGVLFANAESFSKQLSNQFNVIAPGWGAGVRIKLNKYSNTNLCIDYGFGLNGSKGVSVNLGEVF